jgi:hypothetical protein
MQLLNCNLTELPAEIMSYGSPISINKLIIQTKIHKVLSFNKPNWMSGYINFNKM